MRLPRSTTRRALAGAAILCALPAAAAAQPGIPIRAGQPIAGTLAPSDPKLDDGSFYDQYVYRGRPGEQVVVTLRSGAFDAFLDVGTLSGTTFGSSASDDDGAGGTDARLSTAVGAAGVLVIRANSVAAGSTGAYTIEVASGGGGAPAPRPSAGAAAIGAGQTVRGELRSTDVRLDDGSYADEYRYTGGAGDQLVITLRSSAFDTYLAWGSGQGSSFSSAETDDDGAGGTDSQLRVTVGNGGGYTIQANSIAAGATGSYTLSVERAGAAPAGARTLSMGQTVSGRLDASDPKLDDNSHYDLYVYRGRPGERLLVTMRSGDFDAYMAWGRVAGTRFESIASDDDSGGGTNSQLVATVGSSGTYAVQANSLDAGATGAYTLSVQPVGAMAQQQPAAPAGALAIAAGQTVNGQLTRSDAMLSDSSYMDQYVYRGRAGDRLEITLRSRDFDTYLRWGRLEGGRLEAEVNDDDGAGGTDARATVTVGGTGVYVIQANAYEPGKTGSYTLSVRPLGAPTAPTAAEERTAGQRKWLYGFTEPTTPALRTVSQRIRRTGIMERFTESLNSNTNLPQLPRSVGVRMGQCGNVNAYYHPRPGTITMCYELLDHLSRIFVADGQWTRAQTETVDGAVTFIMYHEVGHALVDVMDLPVTGREEDAVDQLATYILVGSGEKGAQAAFNGILALQPRENAVFGKSDFADEHSLGPQRLFNIACWVYGSDPQKYARIVTGGTLPRERAERCPGEYQRMSKAWERLLSANRGTR